MLHKEFAIDPDQLNTIGDIQYLNACFGYERGALISAFPNKWFKAVAGRISRQTTDHQTDVLSEVLQDLKANAVVRFSREYSTTGKWIDSAVASHEQKPFHRIIDPSLEAPPVLVPSIFSLKRADFEVDPNIIRTSESLADAAMGLLFNAEKVTLVDPFLCMSKASYQKTLLALMGRCRKDRVRFLVFSEDDRNKDWEAVQPDLIKFQAFLPDNIELSWFRLSDDGSGFIHPRGLFTGKGGLSYDRGFAEPDSHEQRNTPADIHIMTRAVVEQKARDYNEAQLSGHLRLIHSWAFRR